MLQIRFDSPFYVNDICSEIWLTNLKTKKTRLCLLWHPGWQYHGVINKELEKRGFHFDFR